MTNPTPSPPPKSGEPIVSELDDAIDLLTDDKYRSPEITDARFLVLKAARRVANPDIEAALSVYDACSEDHPDEVSYVRAIVNAALGITTEDDE